MHTRVPADLHDRLVVYAEQTHRSLTSAVAYLLDIGISEFENRRAVNDHLIDRMGRNDRR